MRQLAQAVLQSQGYAVLAAPDGQQAIKMATQHTGTIHLLMTDVVMPGMSGKDLADQMGRMYPGLKVVLMSGYPDEEVLRHGAHDAGVAFLQKPFTPAALAQLVRETLDNREG